MTQTAAELKIGDHMPDRAIYAAISFDAARRWAISRLIYALFAFVPLVISASATSAFADTGIIIVTPKTGDIYFSGSVLEVEVRIDAKLGGKRVYVDATRPGEGALELCSFEAKTAKTSNGGSLHGSRVIPEAFVGPIVITAFAADEPPPWPAGCGGDGKHCSALAAQTPVMSEPVWINVTA